MTSNQPDMDERKGASAGFNALGTVEGLLEGVVAFVTSYIWSLGVLPLHFFAKKPFLAISHALEQKKPLPPLLFNFLGTIPVLVLVAYYGRAFYSIDRKGEWDAVWRILSAEDTAQFLSIAGPPIAAIWVFVSLSSRMLVRVTSQSAESIRVFLLYFVGVLLNYVSIGVFFIFSAVTTSGAHEGNAPRWYVDLGEEYFARVAPVLLIVALIVQIWREIEFKFQKVSCLKRVALTILICTSLFGVAALSGELCNFAWQVMSNVRSDLIKERESKDPTARGALSIDGSRCRSNDEGLRCVVLIHSHLNSDVQLVDIDSAQLMVSRPSISGRALQMYESEISDFKLAPAMNEGETLVLAGGHQGVLYLTVPRHSLCKFTDPEIAGEAYFFKAVFVGVMKNSSRPQGMDVFKPVHVLLDNALVSEVRGGCGSEVRRGASNPN